MTTLPDPFAAERTAQRRARLARVLQEQHHRAALIVTDPVNVRYLTGFRGSNGAVLVDGDDCALFTDSRYLPAAVEQVLGVSVIEARDVLTAALRERGDRRALLEGHAITAARWRSTAADHAGLDLAEDLVGRLRSHKDPAEIAAIEAACQVSQEALLQVLDDGVAGRTERELARRLEWLLADGPGEGPGFASIVAAGPNSAVPHHDPTHRRLERGDLLKIDFGALVRGYHADITRTFVVAADPASAQRAVHGLVLAAQQAGLSAATAGAAVAEVDRAARDVIAAAGHGAHFGHGLGHGVGLQIHERPLIAPKSAGTLAQGMAITIEPGVYLPGVGGVRIEDTAVIEDGGCRSLVALSRDLLTVR